jgi:hypothetical protein
MGRDLTVAGSPRRGGPAATGRWRQTITAADPISDDLRQALEAINRPN